MDDDMKNGSGDGARDDDPGRIVKFPTLAERDQIRKARLAEEKAQEKAWRREYRDQNKVPFFNVERIPNFVGKMALAFLAVHLVVQIFLTDSDALWLFYHFGFVPLRLSGLLFLEEVWGFSVLVSPFSYVLLHGGWTHLIFNVVMWVALGTFFEREFGARETFKFFMFCSLGGILFHFALYFSSSAPVVGASAGISGLFAAVLMLMHQRQNMGQIGRYGLMPMIAFWIALMLLMGLLGGENIAWAAHIGGFVTGLFYLSWRQRRSFKFWQS